MIGTEPPTFSELAQEIAANFFRSKEDREDEARERFEEYRDLERWVLGDR